MGTLVLAGATSGSATLTPVDAVTAVITLPSATATLATLGANTFVGNQAITGTLSATGAISTTTSIKAGGAEALKIWTYKYQITSGDVSAGVSNVTISAVTIANVRGFTLSYMIAGPIIFTERYAQGSSYINSVRISTTTNVEVGLGVNATSSHFILVTIHEAV